MQSPFTRWVLFLSSLILELIIPQTVVAAVLSENSNEPPLFNRRTHATSR
jgi:hypothetical protein